MKEFVMIQRVMAEPYDGDDKIYAVTTSDGERRLMDKAEFETFAVPVNTERIMELDAKAAPGDKIGDVDAFVAEMVAALRESAREAFGLEGYEPS